MELVVHVDKTYRDVGLPGESVRARLMDPVLNSPMTVCLVTGNSTVQSHFLEDKPLFSRALQDEDFALQELVEGPLIPTEEEIVQTAATNMEILHDNLIAKYRGFKAATLSADPALTHALVVLHTPGFISSPSIRAPTFFRWMQSKGPTAAAKVWVIRSQRAARSYLVLLPISDGEWFFDLAITRQTELRDAKVAEITGTPLSTIDYGSEFSLGASGDQTFVWLANKYRNKIGLVDLDINPGSLDADALRDFADGTSLGKVRLSPDSLLTSGGSSLVFLAACVLAFVLGIVASIFGNRWKKPSFMM